MRQKTQVALQSVQGPNRSSPPNQPRKSGLQGNSRILQELRHGIASLKAFLENILYRRDDDNRGRHLSIFRDFLDSQKPKDPQDTEKPFLTQLWQAWSFANQNNNDHLASSLCAIFALILKTLSSLIDFRELGNILCRTILQHQHLRLIKRSLDAPKHKDFLVSPSLRLLTELTSFDGGVFAREVYKRREHFKTEYVLSFPA
jgi:nucleolar pre-ribosomal-associated protein 1